MALAWKETYRQYLPGAGRDVNGNPKQGKTRIVGQAVITSYNSEGEAFSPRDMGLGNLDAASFRVKEETESESGRYRTGVVYTTPAFYLGTFYLYTEGVDGAKTTASGAHTIEVIAEGDSAFDVELR